MSAYEHCSNNGKDRELGQSWERNFCALASKFGKCFTPHQIGRGQSAAAWYRDEKQKWNHYTLPDVTIWTAPGEHHEIKHKKPTAWGAFGLEEYRLNALVGFAFETGQLVMYTIHDHSKSGGRYSTINRIDDWVTADVLTLANSIHHTQMDGTSWVNGQKRNSVPIHYWKVGAFIPLGNFWKLGVKRVYL